MGRCAAARPVRATGTGAEHRTCLSGGGGSAPREGGSESPPARRPRPQASYSSFLSVPVLKAVCTGGWTLCTQACSSSPHAQSPAAGGETGAAACSSPPERGDPASWQVARVAAPAQEGVRVSRGTAHSCPLSRVCVQLGQRWAKEVFQKVGRLREDPKRHPRAEGCQGRLPTPEARRRLA